MTRRRLFAAAVLLCLAAAPPPRDQPSPLDARILGCKGDGAADDLPAFRAAVAAACQAGRPLHIPGGDYRLGFDADQTTAGSWVDVPGDLVVYGDGPRQTRLKTPDSPRAGRGYRLFRVADGAHLEVRDLELAGPSTVDYSTNPYAPGNNGAAKAPTYAISTSDTTVDGGVRLERVRVTGMWLQAIDVGAYSGRGRFDLTLRDCDLESYGTTVGFFSPLNAPGDAGPADRTLIAYNCRFTKSGIPAAPPHGNGKDSYGHTIYAHPDLSFHLENCRFISSVRYAIHLHSGEGKVQPPRHQRIVDCYFGPGVTEGLLLSETGLTVMSGGQYHGGGKITCNVKAVFAGVDFDPANTAFNMASGDKMSPTVQLIGCNLGRNFKAQINAGRWVFSACTAMQGGTLPLAPAGVFVLRPEGDPVKDGDIYWATDQSLMYQATAPKVGPPSWSLVLTGNAPVQNQGGTVQVLGGFWSGAPGSKVVNGAIRHSAGTTAVRGASFSGRFGAGNQSAVAVAPGGTGSLCVDGCNFSLAGGTAITNAGAAGLQATGNSGVQ